MADLFKDLTYETVNGKVILSSKVKVFPTANRGQIEDLNSTKPINLESRLQTERNLTNTNSGFRSCIKSWDTDSEIKVLEVYINGYYFEISDFDITSISDSVPTYLYIKLATTAINIDENTSILSSFRLQSIEDDTSNVLDPSYDQILDYKFGDNYYFTGLFFTTTHITGLPGIQITSLNNNTLVKNYNVFLPYISNGLGTNSVIIGNDSQPTNVIGNYTIAEGHNVIAASNYSHVEGYETESASTANYSHAEGYKTKVYSNGAHAEGNLTEAGDPSSSIRGMWAHAEGKETTASKLAAHAEGDSTTASNTAAHAEGDSTTAEGTSSHAEGYATIASGNYGSHAEGRETKASGISSHAEGDNTEATGPMSHAEGNYTQASVLGAHAEGAGSSSSKVTASAKGAHAEGVSTSASSTAAHAEGNFTSAEGTYSHAEGDHTIAKVSCQHVFGKYNADKSGTIEIAGYGDSSTRKNIRILDTSGNEWLRGGLYIGDTANALGTSFDEKLYVNGTTKITGKLTNNDSIAVGNGTKDATMVNGSGSGILDIYGSEGHIYLDGNEILTSSSSGLYLGAYNDSNSICITNGGQVQANSFYAKSDKRLKENIILYKPEKSILDLPIYKYDFIEGDKNQIGCLAQDLQEICPEIVNKTNDGYLAINESKIVYLLIDEVKKLKAEVEELKKK